MATIHSPPRRSLALGHLVSAYEDVICGELIAGGLDHQFLFEASCSSRERPTAPPTLLCAAHGTGRDLRAQPLVKRQACLQALLERFGCPAVSLSEAFEDGLAHRCRRKPDSVTSPPWDEYLGAGIVINMDRVRSR